MRFKEEFSQVLQIFISAIKDLRSFFLMFFTFVCTFTMIQFILLGKALVDDYPGIHPFIRMFIQTFRTSTGDFQAIDYSNWADNSSASKNLRFSTFE
jgi:hypothetical protein